MAPKAENWIRFWRAPQFGGRLELSRGIGVTHVYPWHWHEEFQVSAMEDGPGYLSFRGAEHLTLPGALVFVPPGEVHTNRHATPAGCTYRTMNIRTDLVARVLGNEPGVESIFSLRQPVVFDRELFRLMVATHARLEEQPSRLSSEILLLRLVEEMARRTAHLRIGDEGREERQAIQRVRQFLAQNYADTVSLEDLSKVANLSPFYLHRTFTREVGLSPHAFQMQVRISRAKILLSEGRPLRTVAAETGFSDQSHFTREFKRVVGLTPGAYRSDLRRPFLAGTGPAPPPPVAARLA